MKNRKSREPITGKLPELPISPNSWERLPIVDAPEWFDGGQVDTGFHTVAVDVLYADGQGHYLGRETAPPRWTMFDGEGRIVRQDTVSYQGQDFMLWPDTFIALVLTQEEVGEEADSADSVEEALAAGAPEQTEAPLVGAVEQIKLSEPMTDEQAAQAGRDLAEKQRDKRRLTVTLKARKKADSDGYKEAQARIDALDAEMSELADEVSDKQRVVHVDCERRADLRSNEWYLVRQSTEDEVPGHRRTMTATEIERLTPLPAEPEPTVGQEQAAAIADGQMREVEHSHQM